MSVLDYTLKLTKLSRYAPSLISDPTDEMRLFVMGVWDNLKEECHQAMLQDNMNISLMIQDQQVKQTTVKRKIRDSNMEKSFDCGSSQSNLNIQASLGS